MFAAERQIARRAMQCNANRSPITCILGGVIELPEGALQAFPDGIDFVAKIVNLTVSLVAGGSGFNQRPGQSKRNFLARSTARVDDSVAPNLAH